MIILKNPHWIKEKSVRWIALRRVYARFKQIERGFLYRFYIYFIYIESRVIKQIVLTCRSAEIRAGHIRMKSLLPSAKTDRSNLLLSHI